MKAMTHIKNISGVLVAVLLLLFIGAAIASAHDEDGDTVARGHDAPVGADTRLPIDEHFDLTPEAAATLRREAEARRLSAVEETEVKRAEVRANIDARVGDVRADADARRVEIREHIDGRRDEFHEDAEERHLMRDERRAEIIDRLTGRAEDRIRQHLDRFTTILDAAIERMHELVRRVAERAELMAENNRDTAAAEEFLNLAVSELDAAEAALEEIEASLDESLVDGLTLQELRELFADTKGAVDSAKQHIRAAHQAVRDAVAALKDAADVAAEAVRQNPTDPVDNSPDD